MPFGRETEMKINVGDKVVLANVGPLTVTAVGQKSFLAFGASGVEATWSLRGDWRLYVEPVPFPFPFKAGDVLRRSGDRHRSSPTTWTVIDPDYSPYQFKGSYSSDHHRRIYNFDKLCKNGEWELVVPFSFKKGDRITNNTGNVWMVLDPNFSATHFWGTVGNSWMESPFLKNHKVDPYTLSPQRKFTVVTERRRPKKGENFIPQDRRGISEALTDFQFADCDVIVSIEEQK